MGARVPVALAVLRRPVALIPLLLPVSVRGCGRVAVGRVRRRASALMLLGLLGLLLLLLPVWREKGRDHPGRCQCYDVIRGLVVRGDHALSGREEVFIEKSGRTLGQEGE